MKSSVLGIFAAAVSVTAATAQAGTSYGDLNGYNITLSDMSKNLPYEIDAEAMAGIN